MKKYSFFLLTIFSIINFYSFGQNADIDILRNVNGHYTQAGGLAFKIVTGSVTPIAFMAPLTIFTIAKVKHEPKFIWDGIQTGSSSLTTGLVTALLKISFQRERPFEAYSDVHQYSRAGAYSFPSGHTSSAFSTATSLSLLYPKWFVIVPAYAWAISAAYSRMYLGVHYPSDVLAGAILGTGISIGIHYIARHRKKKRDAKLNIGFL